MINKSSSFQRYLLNHIKRSSEAMRLLDDVLCHKDRDACVGLYDEFEAERNLIARLLRDSGTPDLEIRQGMIEFSPRAERGSRFESLEKLAITIQGKRILWTLLEEMRTACPVWENLDFEELKAVAGRQRDCVEDWMSEAIAVELTKDDIPNATTNAA